MPGSSQIGNFRKSAVLLAVSPGKFKQECRVATVMWVSATHILRLNRHESEAMDDFAAAIRALLSPTDADTVAQCPQAG
jgi:hypothetical protein